MPSKKFPRKVADAIRDGKILSIRAGKTHRFIGIWVVVVEGRVFVRSWDVESDGWNRTFAKNPRGAITMGRRTLLVRAKSVRSLRLRKAVSRVYAEKYNTPGSRKYVRGFRLSRRMDSTLELTP